MSQAYSSGARYTFSSKSKWEINSSILKKWYIPGVGSYETDLNDIGLKAESARDIITAPFQNPIPKTKMWVNLYDPHAWTEEDVDPGPGTYFWTKQKDDLSDSSNSEYDIINDGGLFYP